MFHQGTVVSEKGFLNELLEGLRFGIGGQRGNRRDGTREIHSLLQILDGMCKHAGEEQVEDDRCQNAERFGESQTGKNYIFF